MKAVGIIVEYNPFHFGHKYHLTQAKELAKADLVIAVMSGNFTQRGTPSIVSKEKRTNEALKQGVNLVIELPYLFAVESADIFAFSALSLLKGLQVDSVVFGAESGPTAAFLEKYALKDYQPPRLDELIKEYLGQGYAYPKAKSLALYAIHDFYLENPNDILGYAYVNAIKQYKLNLTPIIIKRESDYKSIDPHKSISASAVRQALAKNEDVSAFCESSFLQADLHFPENYFGLLKYKILTSTPEQLRTIHLVDEGIEYLFIKQIKTASSLQDFIQSCTSKRYSGARITRTIAHILTNTEKQHAQQYLHTSPPYIRILGSDSIGRKYLASLRKSTTPPIINRFNVKQHPLLAEELKATSIYFAINDEKTKVEEYKKERMIYPIQI